MNQLFNYNGNNVSFRKANDNVYVNATEMAKPFGKLPSGWTRSQQSQDFISSLSAMRNCIPTDLVKVKNGGDNFGTWMHEDVAIEFARWLNPAFAIWCNDRIKELMKFGFTATTETLENLVNNPDLLIDLANALKNERSQKEQAVKQLDLANNTILEQAPKVQLANECYSSTVTMTTTILATRLGYKSASSLNKDLKQLGVQYKIDNCWKLYAKHE